jgi:uncharacterized membrane protein
MRPAGSPQGLLGRMARRLPRRRLGRRGNVAIITALCMPAVIGSFALAIDYGLLTIEKRAMQQTADLAAIAAAGNLANPAYAVRNYLQDNRLDYAIRIDGGYLDAQGRSHAVLPEGAGALSIELGRYIADPGRAVAERFQPDAIERNAARVRVERPGTLHFASIFARPPPIAATGTAQARAMASFSIGSRLLALENGLINDLLSRLIGSRVNLKVMDYEALLAADISLFAFLDALATDIDLTGVTYDRLLREEVSIGRFANALAATDGVEGIALRAVQAIAAAADGTHHMLPLDRFADLKMIAHHTVGTRSGVDVRADALTLLSAAARLARGGDQIGLDLPLAIPGLVRADVTLAIGEMPVGASWLTLGERGVSVRTAQTRLAIDIRQEISISLGLLRIGAKVHVPLFVEAAYGEARLADITCTAAAGQRPTVHLDVRPGVLEAALGTLPPGHFDDFGRPVTVTPAKLVELTALVLSLAPVTASSHIVSGNDAPVHVRFDHQDIAAGRVKRVATDDVLHSLLTSLLANLQIGGSDPGGALATVARLLEPLAAPLDDLVVEALRQAGIRLGEVDLRVSDAQCGRPVLVQ